MKSFARQHMRVIAGGSPEDFQNKMESLFSELATKGIKPEVQYNMAMGFCAYATWEETQFIAETMGEAYELKGEIHHCSECPLFPDPGDKRIKNVKCEHRGKCEETGGVRTTSKGSPACDFFYMKLFNGEIKLKGVSE